jgi:prepilin-type N-terminal cleavage/methylation domain-containing protein
LGGRGRAFAQRLAPAQAAFTLVEILLALLILGLGLMGVLVLFPVGIDAARISAETTRAATIARMAEAELFYVNGPDHKSPFQRILAYIDNPDPSHAYRQRGPWFLPNFDEALCPDPTDGDAAYHGDSDDADNGPEVRPVLIPGLPSGEYSWSTTVARPYDVEANEPGKDALYLLNDLWQNEEVLIVQVTVYRKFSAVGGPLDTGNFAHNSILIDNLNVTGARLESVRGGDWVRYLKFDGATKLYSGDGFWYKVDQVDAPGKRVKLSEKYWGLQGTPVGAAVPLEFTDRIVGTYTFLLSAE